MPSADNAEAVDLLKYSVETCPVVATIEPVSPSHISKSSSSDSKSESSTILYQQTPFEEYRLQVQELCHKLWPSLKKEHRLERLLGGSESRLLGALRSTKLRRQVSPSPIPREFDIERLPGGSFNQIIGVPVASTDHEDAALLILRVPRLGWMARPDRDVAILRYVRQQSSIPVPEIVNFDLTPNNSLGRSYVFQTRLPGYSLQQVYPNISKEQVCVITEEIGKTILAMQSVTSAYPGIVKFSSKSYDSDTFSVRPFDIKDPHDKDWMSKPIDHISWSQDQHKALYEDTLSFLITQFGRWRADELIKDPSCIAWWDYMHRFVDVAKQMGRLGVFDDNENCLCHLDFNARNIMVDPRPDDTITITGVLDWDSAIVAPKFVSCAPPWWVWAADDDDDGADWDEQDESRALEEPPTAHARELKQLFEDTVGEDFLHYAYKTQYRLARRLFRFAVNGMHGNEDISDADKLLEEWSEWYDSAIQQAMKEMENKGEESDSNDSAQGSHEDHAFLTEEDVQTDLAAPKG